MKISSETIYESPETKSISEWIREKFGMTKKSGDAARFDDSDAKVNGNMYNPKYIVILLSEKHPGAKAFFRFRGRQDYIAMSSNGHLNVRGGQDDMFRAWGNSEFRNNKPQSVFEETEKELIKIAVTLNSGGEGFSFDSYGEFIKWLER